MSDLSKYVRASGEDLPGPDASLLRPVRWTTRPDPGARAGWFFALGAVGILEGGLLGWDLLAPPTGWNAIDTAIVLVGAVVVDLVLFLRYRRRSEGPVRELLADPLGFTTVGRDGRSARFAWSGPGIELRLQRSPDRAPGTPILVQGVPGAGRVLRLPPDALAVLPALARQGGAVVQEDGPGRLPGSINGVRISGG
jgi:hypothetical protein